MYINCFYEIRIQKLHFLQNFHSRSAYIPVHEYCIGLTQLPVCLLLFRSAAYCCLLLFRSATYCCSVPLLNAVPLKLWTVHSKLWNYCTVNKFNLWRYCLARCDEIFDHFTLLDETLRHSELCNSVISQIQLHKSAKTCLTVWTVHTEQFWRRISSPPPPHSPISNL